MVALFMFFTVCNVFLVNTLIFDMDKFLEANSWPIQHT